MFDLDGGTDVKRLIRIVLKSKPCSLSTTRTPFTASYTATGNVSANIQVLFIYSPAVYCRLFCSQICKVGRRSPCVIRITCAFAGFLVPFRSFNTVINRSLPNSWVKIVLEMQHIVKHVYSQASFIHLLHIHHVHPGSFDTTAHTTYTQPPNPTWTYGQLPGSRHHSRR